MKIDTINLNQTVRVKLTQEGLEFIENNGDSYNVEDGYVTTQLWHLMLVFGNSMKLHSRSVFEHNNIELIDIEDGNLEEKVRSLERRIDTMFETLRVHRHSIDTQNDTLRIMDSHLKTQSDTMKDITEVINALVKNE